MTSEFEAARSAALLAAQANGEEGMVTSVVIAYQLVDEHGEDVAGWVFDGSRAVAIGLLEMARVDILYDGEGE